MPKQQVGDIMKRALVIEDNEDNMKLITFILEKNGMAQSGPKMVK